MFDSQTIAAIATPPGVGGVGIVRISGAKTEVVTMAREICGTVPKARAAHFCRFLDEQGVQIDQGIALYFPAPHSFTGEHVLELQGHGGPVIMDMIMERVIGLGARMARPGEFTERAFLNDKLDLAQAEAVADLIHSTTRAAAKAAVRSLDGQFSSDIHALVAELIELRVHVEAAIDFPDEDIDFLADGRVLTRLDRILVHWLDLNQRASQGRILRDGINLVMAGQPNAGKSSLLNALAGTEAAIVTETAGTTRDVLRERIQLQGIPVHVIDTAGLRHSDDAIEQEGVRRAWQEIEAADHIFLLVDDTVGWQDEDQAILQQFPPDVPVTVLLNKMDLGHSHLPLHEINGHPVLRLSAKTGVGVNELRAHLAAALGLAESGGGTYLARRRHLTALGLAHDAIERARHQLVEYAAGELVAEELTLAQGHLSDITGEFSSDDLLGEIFSSFCIGK